MNIRPKIPMFQKGGLPSTVTWTDPNSTWFTRSGDFGILEGTYNMLKPLYDKWKSSGTEKDYLAYKKAVDTLNTNLRYGYAPKHLQYLSGNNLLYKDNDVGAWQKYVRDNYGFINNSIGNNFSKYKIHSNNPYSGDNSGKEWKVDNLWAGITDDRTTWGNLLNSNDENYLKWKRKFSEIGIDYRTNPEWNTGDVLYGFLKDDIINGGNPLGDKEIIITPEKKDPSKTGGSLTPKEKTDPESLLSKLGAGLKNVAPDLLDTLRLAGNMINNQRVYNESMKAIKPNLLQSYHTYRQVTGDEATKLAYYRRAVQGELKAARPFTSDADRQVAYMNEAKRIGDELRAQGDLADNLRIRETSAESSAHLDSNRERDTAVANSNITEMNKADAAKHQLTALKYSADWTNLEQYLMGRLYKLELKKAELKELERQLTLLDALEKLIGDTKLRDLKTAYDEAYDAYYNEKDPAKKVALKLKYEKIANDYLLHKIQKSREALKLQYGKEGAKIERKRKEDSLKYLYRTSRDIVEHFRKMSKMTDDSRVRTMPKPIKLPSHPKKFLYGGVAPFTIYRPLGVGGESSYAQSTASSSGSGKSEKDTAAKDKLDMIKELFKNIKGLPVDVAKVYLDIIGTLNKAKALGEELSTDDIATMYLSSMQKMAQLKYSEDAYEKAKALATLNEALNEIAVGTSGEMVFLNLNTGEYKIGTIGSKMFKDKEWNPLTNDLILELRAKSPNMVFNDLMFNIVNNGVGLNKISAEIKSLAAGLSTTDRKIEGISEVQSNKIKAGLQTLAGFDGTPDGYYKITKSSKDSKANIDAALNYIYNVLPTNYKTILAVHSGSEENSKKWILDHLVSLAHNSYEESISPLTGKASDKDNSKESSEGLKLDAATALITGKGYQTEIELNPGSSYSVKALGRFTEFLKLGGGNMGAGTTMLEATESTLNGTLDWNKATIGGSKIIPTAYNQIILNNGEVAGVDLPVDPNNPDAPNFEMLKQLEELDKQLKLNNIEDNEQNWLKVNDLCDKLGIPHKYDSSGKLNRLTWKRFAAFLVTTPDTVLVDKNVILDMVGVANDLERELYNGFIQQKTKNKNFELSDTFLGIFGHRDELYKGTVFVPVKESIVAAAISGGQHIHMSLATDLELRERGYDPNKINSYKKSEYSL